jgi:glycosyltransferase involved in cell wall biosynthesis
MIDMHSENSVLLIGNFISANGGSRGVCEDLVPHLKSCGWKVTYTSTKSARLPRLLDMLFTIVRRKEEYAVAHVDIYSGRAFLLAEIVCNTLRCLGKPFVLTLRGGNLPDFARRFPRRVRSLLGLASAVTTPSRYLQEQMTPYRTELQVLPNPLQLDNYTFQPRSTAKPRLVWMRAFHAIYNPRLAVTATALARRDIPDIQLTMLGTDKRDGSQQATEELIETLNLSEQVAVRGPVHKRDVPGWLSTGDIFLNTPNVDNTPVSVMEAMASGLCVVSTNAGGIPYLLTHEQDALLVPPDNPTEMASAIRRILTDQEFAVYLSRNARRKAEEFDWAVIRPQWEQLFRNVLQSNFT